MVKPETSMPENFVLALQFHQGIDSAAPTSGHHEQDQKESRVAESITDIQVNTGSKT